MTVATPCTIHSGNFAEVPIRRLPRVKVEEIVRERGVPIISYNLPNRSALSILKFTPMIQLQSPYTLSSTMTFDLLWHIGWFFRGIEKPRPNWSGFM